MLRKNLAGKIALVACIALVATLLPVATGFGATWTRIATGGITNVDNTKVGPGVKFQGKMMVGGGNWSGPGPIPTPALPATMYSYDGTSFTQVGTPGLGDANNTALLPWGVLNNELYIGTRNSTAGGQLWKWTGSGNPTPVIITGLAANPLNTEVFPIAVYKNELIVQVTNTAGAPNGGMLLYKFNGTTWTQIIGQGAAGTPAGPGLGNPNNIGTAPSEMNIFNGKLILPVENQVQGLQVYSYDGTSFTLIGQAGAGTWPATHEMGAVYVSGNDGKLYMGTGKETPPAPLGALWSYDGTSWTQITLSGGMEDTNNWFFFPLVRGANLYVDSWNAFSGCRIYKRSGTGFTAISDPGFGIATNRIGTMSSFNGRLLGFTGYIGPPGGEIYTTPIPPSIDALVPNTGPYGTVVSILGNDFGSTQGSSTVTFKGKVAPDVISWRDNKIEVIVPPTAATGPVQVTTANGPSNEVLFTLGLSKTWFFAEGTTRDNDVDGRFEEWICIQNPNNATANVTLTYMLGDGTNRTQHTQVTKKSRKTVSVHGFLGKNHDNSTLVNSDQLVLAERPMYFNYRNKWTGGHDVIGVPAPRKSYYFAEGTTRDNEIDGTFDEWICLQNPNTTDATVNVKYLLGTGQVINKPYPVKKKSRRTVDVNLDVGKDQDVSAVVTCSKPIVAERPMYFNYHGKWTGGHNVIGAPGPDTTFFFAEGTTRDNSTDGVFEEWICLQNANTLPASVKITYYTDQKGTQTQNVTVGPNARETVDVKLKLGKDVDTAFKITSNRPILAERPMYFTYHNAWTGGHDVMGCNSPARSFYFAEGNTLTNFATYIALMNPGGTAAHITITYMPEDSTNKNIPVTVNPRKRYTRNMARDISPNKNVSIKVSCPDQDIVVERPMYFDYGGWATGGHDTLGYGI